MRRRALVPWALATLPWLGARPLLAALDGGPTSELGWEEYAVDLPHTEHVRRDDPGPRAAWLFQTRIERRATVPRGRHVPQ